MSELVGVYNVVDLGLSGIYSFGVAFLKQKENKYFWENSVFLSDSKFLNYYDSVEEAENALRQWAINQENK